MCSENVIRRLAGSFIVLSALLTWTVSPWWLLFTTFVGFNLVQSSFTSFCPLERILGRFGVLGCRKRT